MPLDSSILHDEKQTPTLRSEETEGPFFLEAPGIGGALVLIFHEIHLWRPIHPVYGNQSSKT